MSTGAQYVAAAYAASADPEQVKIVVKVRESA